MTVVEGESSSAAFQGVNVQDFIEMFNQERENDKSTEDLYALSGTTVKFQRFDVTIEGLPLLEKILSKHPNFTKCTYGNAVRKVMFMGLPSTPYFLCFHYFEPTVAHSHFSTSYTTHSLLFLSFRAPLSPFTSSRPICLSYRPVIHYSCPWT